MLCRNSTFDTGGCTDAVLSPRVVAYFKTPTLRDLGQSNPYLHNGSMNNVEHAINFNIGSSTPARDYCEMLRRNCSMLT